MDEVLSTGCDLDVKGGRQVRFKVYCIKLRLNKVAEEVETLISSPLETMVRETLFLVPLTTSINSRVRVLVSPLQGQERGSICLEH